jgi:hypothetical protein
MAAFYIEALGFGILLSSLGARVVLARKRFKQNFTAGSGEPRRMQRPST